MSENLDMQKNTRRNIFVAATYGGVLMLGLILGQYYSNEQRTAAGGVLDPLGVDNSYKIQGMMDLISSSYVDSINMDAIQDDAISHILSRLDPYSAYLQAAEAQNLNETLEGTFEGIGLEYFNLNDTLLVVSIIPNGPADKAGFRVGDQLLQIDTKTIAGVGMPLSEVDKMIRGKRGSALQVLVKREGYMLGKPIKVIRDQVNVSSLDAAYLIQPAVAYIKIRRFGLKTAEEFKKALKELEKRGARSIIVDLRENGGGYLHAAIQLASEFFKDKKLIVYTKGYNELRKDYFSSADGVFPDGKVAVLINENSASASEIFAGAIQDLDRGTIVGRRSYGKGLVQERFELPDGSTINLSVARYFTPLGRDIQKKYTLNAFVSPTSAEPLWLMDSTYVHEQAFVTKGGNQVYNGGGIYPDVVVPIDSNALSLKYQEINSSSLTEQFVYERFTKKSPAYSIENFIQGYHLPDKEYADFMTFLKNKGIVLSKKQENDLHQLIQTDIESLVGRFYFGRDAYFKVRNRHDVFVERAVNVLAPILN